MPLELKIVDDLLGQGQRRVRSSARLPEGLEAVQRLRHAVVVFMARGRFTEPEEAWLGQASWASASPPYLAGAEKLPRTSRPI
jgi:hypothetical protein